jgi:hypothetical protein
MAHTFLITLLSCLTIAVGIILAMLIYYMATNLCNELYYHTNLHVFWSSFYATISALILWTIDVATCVTIIIYLVNKF